MGRIPITAAFVLIVFLIAACLSGDLLAQNPARSQSQAAISIEPDPAPAQDIRTTRQKWQNFVRETVAPMTFGASAFNATFSQLTQGNPQYGRGGVAWAKRYGASVADIATENFFGDFVVASAFRLDPRYHRMGPGRSLSYRTGYAISRAFVIGRDTGGNTFNFSNVFGNAMSAGFSNVYYPAPSRTFNAFLSHFAISVIDTGFANLAPEFWPDFRDRVFRRNRRHNHPQR